MAMGLVWHGTPPEELLEKQFHISTGFHTDQREIIEQIAERLKQIIFELCKECQAEILSIEIMPDHVHLLVECDPQFGIHQTIS